jgi:hypothetical protein
MSCKINCLNFKNKSYTNLPKCWKFASKQFQEIPRLLHKLTPFTLSWKSELRIYGKNSTK